MIPRYPLSDRYFAVVKAIAPSGQVREYVLADDHDHVVAEKDARIGELELLTDMQREHAIKLTADLRWACKILQSDGNTQESEKARAILDGLEKRL